MTAPGSSYSLPAQHPFTGLDAWSLLTGITTPGHDEMRSFRRFASRYLIPNAAPRAPQAP